MIPDNPNSRVRKAFYTANDLKLKARDLRDELLANLEFMESVIRKDRLRLERYEAKFNDLRYRPIIREGSDSIEPEYGPPSQVVLEPLASQYRASINSLLQSIKLIQSEIIGEEPNEPAPDHVKLASDKRQAVRQAFKAEATKARALSATNGPAPIQDGPSNEPALEIPATKLVETSPGPVISPNRPATSLEPDSEPELIPPTPPKPRPWRDTTPKNSSATNPEPIKPTSPHVVEPPKPLDPNKVGLSPALRAQLAAMGGASKLASIKAKYNTEEEE